MPSVFEGLSRFVGRVEILALGLDDKRRTAEAALARNRPLDAREAAREILKEVPDSLVGLALWADAAEDAWLDHEVVEALAELGERLPFRADIWLRLGRAGLRTDYPQAREALERAAAASDDRASAREALLDLCDMDLVAGDAGRARHWLERIPVLLTGADPPVLLRRAECALAFGDVDTARDAVAKMGESSPLDGRAALLQGRVAFASGEPDVAFDHALRAFLLEVPGSTELFTAVVSSLRDAVLVDRAREIVKAAGAIERPAWAAAFAFAEGRRDDARAALLRATAEGDRGAAEALLRMAIEMRDLPALTAVLAKNAALVPQDLALLAESVGESEAGHVDAALDRLARVGGDASGWALDIAGQVAARWIPPVARAAEGGAESVPEADWPNVLRALRDVARGLDRIDVLGRIEALAIERERPLRVAIVGEFNAGKSTFINALLGEDVAPTGVLPTTATLHWVAWAPDAFARVVVPGSPDRVVSHAALKPTLKALEAEGKKAERVFIYAPIERLKRIEILDTPGFNAPDPDHIAAARQAFDEAHLAVWLLDATMPFKDSERRILAEIASLGVPIQLLANKADRLSAEARERVLDHVNDGLVETKIASYGAPLLLSARLALKGMLGDAEALAASGWPAVEVLLSERIVDRAGALRERALRRRALRVATTLVETAAQRTAEGRERARALRESTERTRALADRLRGERASLAALVEKAIEPARRALAADLRPLAALGPDRRAAAAGPRAYIEERFVARLAEPIVREIVKVLWDDGAETPPLYRPTLAVRAVLYGAVASQAAPAALADEPLLPIVDAAIVAFSVALAEQTAEAPAPSALSAIELRAGAIRTALERGS